jgi:hypothetical protein
MRSSSFSSLLTLLVLSLAGFGVACIPGPPPPEGGGSEATTAGSSSGGAGGSYTSAMEGTETSTGPEPVTSSSSSGPVVDSGESFLVPTDGGCSVVATPDGLQPRCIYECEVLAPLDCGRDERCMPWSNDGGQWWNVTRCSPIAEDPAGLGEPCVAEGSPVSGLDSCDFGLLCFGVDPTTLQGTCTAMCNPDLDVLCADDEICAEYDHFAPFVCMPRCDPLDPAACAADEACRPVEYDLLCVPTIVLPQGFECNTSGEHCAVGEACLGAEVLASCDEAQCCRPWCDLSAADPDLPCSAMPGEVCRPYFDGPPAGHEHVGVCGLPL